MTTRKVLWGLLLLGCGVLLLFQALGIGQEYDAIRLIGSLLLIGLAIVSFVQFRFFLSLLPVAFVVYLWRNQLGLENVNIFLLIAAAALLGIGLSVIFHKKTKLFKQSHVKFDPGPAVETLSSDEFVNIEASFGEQTKYIHASNLKKVNISGNFCSVKVFFDQCEVADNTLYVNVSGNFSGIELSMPRNWIIQNNINTFAAEFKDQDAYYGGENPIRVIMQGSANFAEIKVRHV
jgi:predicted membrane protein